MWSVSCLHLVFQYGRAHENHLELLKITADTRYFPSFTNLPLHFRIPGPGLPAWKRPHSSPNSHFSPKSRSVSLPPTYLPTYTGDGPEQTLCTVRAQHAIRPQTSLLNSSKHQCDVYCEESKKKSMNISSRGDSKGRCEIYAWKMPHNVCKMISGYNGHLMSWGCTFGHSQKGAAQQRRKGFLPVQSLGGMSYTARTPRTHRVTCWRNLWGKGHWFLGDPMLTYSPHSEVEMTVAGTLSPFDQM